MRDFKSIEYLSKGNSIQQASYKVLLKSKIVHILKDFDITLAGTIPIEINLPESDLDLICEVKDRQRFIHLLNENFQSHQHFKLEEKDQFILSSFEFEGFQFEIYGEDKPVSLQNAYRHMLIEYSILKEKGEDFRQEVLALKKLGIKTEPAFSKLLGIKGDPYQGLLDYGVLKKHL
ncbi:DUF4269 domain-containing protein [Flammeovirga sp. SR4]|uniref:DUF4269 domain-containing protein n=1 Tax=Flammeovirga agarivorans TaxID=2726742 RepID=A0A7X8SIG3_9BACT|nr:DUF4269 domain-containing protein [Flammeovirga agarivorans]